jgi:hypothetical protein
MQYYEVKLLEQLEAMEKVDFSQTNNFKAMLLLQFLLTETLGAELTSQVIARMHINFSANVSEEGLQAIVKSFAKLVIKLHKSYQEHFHNADIIFLQSLNQLSLSLDI